MAGLPVAETKYGNVRGSKLTCRESTQMVLAFLGVPYAKAPVGDLRLAVPEHPQPWDGERDAIKYGIYVTGLLSFPVGSLMQWLSDDIRFFDP